MKKWIWILVIVAIICSVVIFNKLKKAELVRNVDEARMATGKAYEEILPVYTAKRYSWIKDVSCSTQLTEDPQSYLGDKTNTPKYYEWNDCVNLTFTADSSFDSLSDYMKLKYFKDLHDISEEKAEQILESTSPLYYEYFHQTEIMDLRDMGIFPNRQVSIYIKTEKNTYDYLRNEWCSAEVFRQNERDIDPAHDAYQARQSTSTEKSSFSYSSGGSTNSRYSSGSKSYNYKSSWDMYLESDDMPDCDDYEDWDEFMDDWDGNMPDGSDASDYWDDW